MSLQKPTDLHPGPVVYRLFDSGSTLLYIGSTGNVERRLQQHSADQPWWPRVTRVELEHFANRSDALDAEGRAIFHEKPRFNKKHEEAWRDAAVAAPTERRDAWWVQVLAKDERRREAKREALVEYVGSDASLVDAETTRRRAAERLRRVKLREAKRQRWAIEGTNDEGENQ
jgi:predicted GIY-YIG superfamily endonuclease